MYPLLRRARHVPYMALGLLPFLFVTAITFLELPSVWPDEAIFADTVHHISLNGIPATNLFLDIVPGMQQRSLWYPPLYFYVVALWTQLTSLDIVPIRIFSVLVSCVSLMVLYAFSVRITKQKWLGALSMLLLGIDYSFLRAGQVGRMDAFTFLWIITALYAGYEGRRRNRAVWLLAAGIASGLAILTHPLGAIAPATLVVYLFITRRSPHQLIREYGVFLFPIAVAVIGWYWWIGSYFDAFITQYQLQFERKAESPFFMVMLVQYFLSWRLTFLLYIGIYLYAITVGLRKQFELVLLLLIGLVVSIFIAMWGKEMWYTLYLQPWITLFLITLLYNSAVRRSVTYGATVLYIIFNIWLIAAPITKYPSYSQTQSALVNAVPHTGTIYLSQIPDPYFFIRKQFPSVKLLEFPTVPVSDELYDRLLEKSDYLIINQVFDERINSYIQKNMLTKTPLYASDGTEVSMLIKLVPQNKRK